MRPAVSAALAQGQYDLGEPLTTASDLGYRLGGVDGVPKYFGDYANLATLGHTGNLTVTYLGSFNVLATPAASVGLRCVRVDFKVTNTSSFASAVHLPLYGIIPGYRQVENLENSLFENGPLSPTTQTITWSENVGW